MKPELVKTFDVTTSCINEKNATVWLSMYMSDHSPALFLTSEEGESLAVATVNLEQYGYTPAPGHVYIKNYSENAGLLEALVEAKVISEPVNSVPCGFETAYECKLLK